MLDIMSLFGGNGKEDKGDNWVRDIAEWVGKAIPNEFSKLNSYSKYYQYIPVIGQVLSAASRIGSGVDNAATAYADTGNIGLGIQGAATGISGGHDDPGKYGSGYLRTGKVSDSGGWANTAGKIGDFLPSFGGGASSGGDGGGFSFGGGGSSGMLGMIGNMFSSNKSGGGSQGGGNSLGMIGNLLNMFGSNNSQGGSGGGSGSGGNMLGMLGNVMNMFGSKNQSQPKQQRHSNAWGSGRDGVQLYDLLADFYALDSGLEVNGLAIN